MSRFSIIVVFLNSRKYRSKFLLANTVMLALNGFVSFFVPRLELSYNRVKVLKFL